jgi:hypothetical protein
MEDIGAGPFGSSRIELWIQHQLVNSRRPEYIADELIKAWESHELFFDAKEVVTHFCLVNGFIPSLIRIIKLDLRSGFQLPWALLFILFKSGEKAKSTTVLPRDLTDAFLAGASRDNQLHALSASALQCHDTDPRWENIFQNELKDRLNEIKSEREKIFKELLIFRSEGMNDEVKNTIDKILTIFPDDAQALSLQKSLGDREFEGLLEKLRQKYEKKAAFEVEDFENPLADSALVNFPLTDFIEALDKVNPNLDLNQSYYLSIGLVEMGLSKLALETLKQSEKTWTTREKLWAIEIRLKIGEFAEALSCAQIILNQNRENDEIVKACLYFSAKAYFGLEDPEQAIAIVKGIITHAPLYRDCTTLLNQWEQGPK